MGVAIIHPRIDLEWPEDPAQAQEMQKLLAERGINGEIGQDGIEVDDNVWLGIAENLSVKDRNTLTNGDIPTLDLKQVKRLEAPSKVENPVFELNQSIRHAYRSLATTGLPSLDAQLAHFLRPTGDDFLRLVMNLNKASHELPAAVEGYANGSPEDRRLLEQALRFYMQQGAGKVETILEDIVPDVMESAEVQQQLGPAKMAEIGKMRSSHNHIMAAIEELGIKDED